MAKLPKSIIKKYGITKKAWAVFRGQKSTRRPTVSKKRKSIKTRYLTRVKSAGRRAGGRARGLLGSVAGLTLKSLAFGTAGIIATDRYQPYGGAYRPALNKVLIGVTGPMVGMDNRDMLTVGVKEGLATFVGGYLGGNGANTPAQVGEQL